jgi:tetratricopeptide (TPR) repeat protein
MLYFEGNYLESEIMISEALQLLKKSNDTELLYTSYTLLGSNFEKLEEYDSALKYYLLAKSKLPDLFKKGTEITKINNYKVTSAVNIAAIYDKIIKFYYYSRIKKRLAISIRNCHWKFRLLQNEKWPIRRC